MRQMESLSKQWSELSGYVRADRFMHYSFDFWNTIAFSNPQFKEARAEFIHHYFNGQHSKDFIQSAFSHVGGEYNTSIEANGNALPVDELYMKVFSYLGAFENVDLSYIKFAIFKLFLEYPPSISEHFMNMLSANARHEASLSITSNTAFIPGFVIKEFLRNAGILQAFSFCIFSDEAQLAKPNRRIFQLVLNHVHHRTTSACKVLQIIAELRVPACQHFIWITKPF
jgi:FMN phosphatase YigB (HAD superfamily)